MNNKSIVLIIISKIYIINCNSPFEISKNTLYTFTLNNYPITNIFCLPGIVLIKILSMYNNMIGKIK